jgi:hypothetical protein
MIALTLEIMQVISACRVLALRSYRRYTPGVCVNSGCGPRLRKRGLYGPQGDTIAIRIQNAEKPEPIDVDARHPADAALSRHAEPGASSYAAPGDSQGPNVLQFRRYGDLYFLSKIFWLGSRWKFRRARASEKSPRTTLAARPLQLPPPSKVNLHGSPESELEYARTAVHMSTHGTSYRRLRITNRRGDRINVGLPIVVKRSQRHDHALRGNGLNSGSILDDFN